jgi:nucleoside 2-deoxyribosyltransferase
MKIYLAGAIEAAPDEGKGWRAELTSFLSEQLDWEVFDPSQHEQDFLSVHEKTNFRSWKTTDINKFRSVIAKIIDRDLDQLLNQCDGVIVLWDKYVLPGGGTHGELTLAYEHKMPVYLVLGMPLAEVSSWIVGCTTELFEDFESLQKYLLGKYASNAKK